MSDNSRPGMEAEVSSPGVSDLPDKYSNVSSLDFIEMPMAKSTYHRVKVKLKTSNMLESQHNYSDAHTQSDIDKSCLKAGTDKYGIVEKAEDSSSSFSMVKVHVSGVSSNKSGGIKIKSSSRPFSDPHSSKDELNAALVVIKKVMKMDAAEPFNAPVNPEELGIPDYFDVIETPMDFGSIRKNLENFSKYSSSEDVYKDVQYIWENCYKYNNKGDYILDLMKRVKKNFAKYWAAAGLYIEPSKRGFQNTHEGDAFSAEGKLFTKSGHSKNKVRKRHGYKYHKEDCLCAICVMKRRRKEREEGSPILENLVGSCDPNFAQKFSQEEEPVEESPPSGGDTSSNNMDLSGEDAADTDTELDEKEEACCPKEDYPPEDREEELKGKEGEEGAEKYKSSGLEGGGPSAPTSPPLQQKLKETKGEERKRVMQVLERYENPLVVEMYGRLFSKEESVWSGPHSLAAAVHVVSQTGSSIHRAVAGLM